MSEYQSIVIGAGFAGAVAARELAQRFGQKVLVIDKRDHIGGNCYDLKDEYGVTIHQYGPHIFHTNEKRVYDYLSQFSSWYDYSHEVVGNIHGLEIPIPFNLNTLRMVYADHAGELEKKLTDKFGEGARVPILKLMEDDDVELKEIADYVYQNIFLKYTMKQWGKKPEEIDPAVSGRVPVLLSHDNRYFQDTYQGMPKDGYTHIFDEMLGYDGIDVRTKVEALDVLDIDPDGESPVKFEGKKYTGRIIYTGAVDELFGCRYGRLPYRTLRFDFEHYDKDYYQSHGVVNYTVSEDFTRITEFKYLTGQTDSKGTTIVKEYPSAYTGAEGEIPYYAINNDANDALFDKYKKLADSIPNLYLLGRLAEYKYYNIDGIVLRALKLVDSF